ncbi:MAG: hypothetical protein KCHDKBKB_01634 [Elusimicrobia bacterium]|nr:hypothetical protein [Elusimicrobiota bacterium]
MILPTKRLPSDRSLIAVGADILSCIDQPKTVSRLWSLVKEKTLNKGKSNTITFDWFVLGLDILFALSLVSLVEGRVMRTK